MDSDRQAPAVFDRAAVRRQRDRMAPSLEHNDFLIREIAERLAERLGDVRRAFPTALDLGCHSGQLARALQGRDAIDHLIQADLSPAMIRRGDGLRIAADEEFLPFGANSFDLVLSCFSLHWVNDLPGALAQICHALKPDGMFLAAMAGGTTLFELRESLMRAELELGGGAALRVSPFVDLRDSGSLLQRAGLALPITDVETIIVTYDHPLKLMQELRAMGEANALIERDRRPLRRSILMRAAEIYHELFADARGRIPATFQILMLSAWKPAPSQPKPIKRGSGQVSLAKAFGVPPEVLEGKSKA
ncbi:MAG: methyltransferase domain-containing protein [Pseudomonadota bacterium]